MRLLLPLPTLLISLASLPLSAADMTPTAPTTGAAPAQPAWTTAVEHDEHGFFADFKVQGVAQRMRWIRPGGFSMGSGTSARPVTLGQGFWLGDSEVTQGMWQAVTGGNPSSFTGDANRPVEQVSWDDCQGFFQKLNGQIAGLRAGFPTEAQWEYACRAGSSGDYAGDLNAMAWYDKNASNQTHAVKTKAANAWGLFDMHGNVLEWCSDWSADFTDGPERDPVGPTTGTCRVDRGGCWNGPARFCQSSRRDEFSPGTRNRSLGFRLAAQAAP